MVGHGGQASPRLRSRSSIGIGHVEAREDLALEPFHRFGLGVDLVIVADEMEKAMHGEMGEVMKELFVFIVAFLAQRLVGDHDVAEAWPGRRNC